MSPEYQLIQLCAHLYSEAVYFCYEDRWIRDKFDLNLIKFCDINELIIKENIDWKKLSSILKINNIKEPIYYSLSLLNKLYGNTVPEDFLKELNVDEKIIDIFYDKCGKETYWELNFPKRMFSIKDKVDEIIKRGIL